MWEGEGEGVKGRKVLYFLELFLFYSIFGGDKMDNFFFGIYRWCNYFCWYIGIFVFLGE